MIIFHKYLKQILFKNDNYFHHNLYSPSKLYLISNSENNQSNPLSHLQHQHNFFSYNLINSHFYSLIPSIYIITEHLHLPICNMAVFELNMHNLKYIRILFNHKPYKGKIPNHTLHFKVDFKVEI